MGSTYRLSLPDLSTMELMLKDPNRCALEKTLPSDSGLICLSGFSGSRQGLSLHDPTAVVTTSPRRLRRVPRCARDAEAYKKILYGDEINVIKPTRSSQKAAAYKKILYGNDTDTVKLNEKSNIKPDTKPNAEQGSRKNTRPKIASSQDAEASEFWWNSKKKFAKLEMNKMKDIKNNQRVKRVSDRNRNNIPDRLVFPKYKTTGSIGIVEKANKLNTEIFFGDAENNLTMNQYSTLPTIEKQNTGDALKASELQNIPNPASEYQTMPKPHQEPLPGAQKPPDSAAEPFCERNPPLVSKSACGPSSPPIGHLMSTTSISSAGLDKSSSLTVTSEVHNEGTPSPNVSDEISYTDTPPKTAQRSKTSMLADVKAIRSETFDINEDGFPSKTEASSTSVRWGDGELTAPANSPQPCDKRETDYVMNKITYAEKIKTPKLSVVTLGSPDAPCFVNDTPNVWKTQPRPFNFSSDCSLNSKAEMSKPSVGLNPASSWCNQPQKVAVQQLDFRPMLEIEAKPVFQRCRAQSRRVGTRARAHNTVNKAHIPSMLGLKVQSKTGEGLPFGECLGSPEPCDNPSQSTMSSKSFLPSIYQSECKKCTHQVSANNTKLSGKMSFKSFYNINNTENEHDYLNINRYDLSKARCPVSGTERQYTRVCEELGHHMMMGHRTVPSEDFDDRMVTGENPAKDHGVAGDLNQSSSVDQRNASKTASKATTERKLSESAMDKSSTSKKREARSRQWHTTSTRVKSFPRSFRQPPVFGEHLTLPEKEAKLMRLF